jgi:hypothetical protein
MHVAVVYKDLTGAGRGGARGSRLVKRGKEYIVCESSSAEVVGK